MSNDSRPTVSNGTDSMFFTPPFNIVVSKIVTIVIYSIISFTIIFNLRVIYIILRILLRRHKSTPSARQHDSNKHAFLYVLALSVVDSFVLAHMPLVITDVVVGQWVFGAVMCKLYWIIEQLNRTLSTFILTALSGDRYLAVCHPLRFRHWRTTRGVSLIIAGCVCVAAVLLTPVYMYSHITVLSNFTDYNITKCAFEMDTLGNVFIIYIFVCGYCIPFALMVYFYGSILRTLWRQQAFSAGGTNSSALVERGQRRAQHVTRRAFTLVLFYFVCWTPYWMVQFPIQYFAVPSEDSAAYYIVPIVMHAVHILVYVNSAVNPFLYASLNNEMQRQHGSTAGQGHGSQAHAHQHMQQQTTCLQTQSEYLTRSINPSPAVSRSCENAPSGDEDSDKVTVAKKSYSYRCEDARNGESNATPLLLSFQNKFYAGDADNGVVPAHPDDDQF